MAPAPFDPRLPCRTRNGRKVEILAVLPPEKATNENETIVALVDVDDPLMRSVEVYRADGVFDPRRPTTWDLVNVPPLSPVLQPEADGALRDFHNRLRILSSIDFHELVQAGVVTDDADGEAEWKAFRGNPWRWFIVCGDDEAEKLWALIEKRAVRTVRGPA